MDQQLTVAMLQMAWLHLAVYMLFVALQPDEDGPNQDDAPDLPEA